MNLRSQSSHWYRHHNGVTEPCYELPKKSGPGLKAVTLREARELHLLPSVTTVLGVISKPELTNWLVGNGIMAALTLPRIQGEPVDDFVKRVIEDADKQSDVARDFGTRIHDAIENFLTLQLHPIGEEVEPFVEPTLQWLDENLQKAMATESCVGCPIIGVAGRLDLFGELKNIGPAVIDFKTQRVREKPAFYFEFPLQLAAYSRLLGPVYPTPALVSVVIDSGKPSTPHIKVWEQTTFYYWNLFQSAFELWCYRSNYDPRKQS